MAAKKPKERKVGTVEHYYPKVQAASVGLEDDLKLGDTIHIKGHGDDLTEKVTSMQLDHRPIQEGHAGQHIGVQVPQKVHEKAEVFKVEKAAAARAAPKKAPKKAAKKTARRPKAAKRTAKKAPRKAARKPKKAARKAAKHARKAKRTAKRAAPKKAKRAKPSRKR